jgi:hypothetical protein
LFWHNGQAKITQQNIDRFGLATATIDYSRKSSLVNACGSGNLTSLCAGFLARFYSLSYQFNQHIHTLRPVLTFIKRKKEIFSKIFLPLQFDPLLAIRQEARLRVPCRQPSPQFLTIPANAAAQRYRQGQLAGTVQSIEFAPGNAQEPRRLFGVQK